MTGEEAIIRLKNMAWLYGSAERKQNIEAINMAIEALQDKPKDEWLIFKYGNLYKCSKCHEVYDRKFTFCPNCGADMRGKEE